MLGSDALSVRLAGIHSLHRLARDCPELYHGEIVKLFCDFARNPTEDEKADRILDTGNELLPMIRVDVQAVIDAIDERRRDRNTWEQYASDAVIDLSGANLRKALLLHHNLSNAILIGANLSWAKLDHAQLVDASLEGVDLSYSSLNEANLSRAMLQFVVLTDAYLGRANLSRAVLTKATLSHSKFLNSDLTNSYLCGAEVPGAIFKDATVSGANFSSIDPSLAIHSTRCKLTQAQLDEARSDPTNPPKLNNLLDPDTLEPLVWRGHSL